MAQKQISLDLPLDLPRVATQKFQEKKKSQVLSQVPVPKPKAPERSTEIVEKDYTFNLDSRSRDYNLYPKACDMTINLPDSVRNVSKIELHSIEIPNAAQVINENNNNLYWLNDGERDVRANVQLSADGIDQSTAVLTFEDPHNLYFQDTVYLFNCPGLSEAEGHVHFGIRDAYTLTFSHDMSSFFGTFVTCSVDLGTPLYNVIVRPGNYNLVSIAAQVQLQMNSIKNTFDFTFHRFLVVPNTDTDIINFKQFKTRNLQDNPVQTQINSNTVTVLVFNHGQAVGTEICLFDTINVGNYQKTDLDGIHTITAVTDNSISFELTVPCTSTTAGGGTNVLLGVPVLFKLFFNPLSPQTNLPVFGKTIDYNLGFPREPSSVQAPELPEALVLTPTNFGFNSNFPGYIEIRVNFRYIDLFRSSTRVDIGTLDYTFDDPDKLFIITNDPHGITQQTVVHVDTNCYNGYTTVTPYNPFVLYLNNVKLSEPFSEGTLVYGPDQVRLENFNVSPVVDPYKSYFVELVDYQTSTFRIKETFSFISPFFSDAKVHTTKLKFNWPGHPFNEITKIESNVPNRTKVTTKIDHGLSGVIIDNVYFNRTLPGTLDLTIVTTRTVPSQSSIQVQSNSLGLVDLTGDFVVSVTSSPTVFRIIYPGSSSISGTMTVGIGDSVVIANTNCVPQVYGYYSVDTTFGSSKTFIIYNTIPNLTSPGTYGTLGYENRLTISRTSAVLQDFPEFASCEQKTCPVQINLYDPDIFFLNTEFFSLTTDAPASNANRSLPFVSSETLGMSYSISNTVDWKPDSVLYRRVNLKGEDYFLMCSKQLASPESRFYITNQNGKTRSIDYVFAKVQLDSVPGAVTFHQGVFKPIQYYPTIGKLNTIQVQLYQFDGNFFDILRLDYSFSLVVTQQEHRISDTQKHVP